MTHLGELISAFRARQACANNGADMLALIGAAIQDFTKVGFVGQSLGMIGWGLALLTGRGGWIGRAVGGLGVVCGGATAVTLIGSHIVLTPHSLLHIFGLYGLWYLAVAAWLIAVRRPA